MINKICDLYGNKFQAKQEQERYCKDKHYVSCFICGTPTLLKTPVDKINYLKKGFRTCSQKCAKEKMKLTNKEKYGYVTPLTKKEVREKIKHTMLQRYGAENILKTDIGKERLKKAILNRTEEQKQEHIKKIQETNLKKYGLKSTLQLPKSRETMKERYGAEYTGSSKILQNKMKKTNQTKYGVDFPFQSREIQKQFSNLTPIENVNIINNKEKLKTYILNVPYKDRTIQYVANKLQTNYSQFSTKIKNYNFYTLFNHYTSNFEQEVKDFLDSLNIQYEQHNRTLIYPYELDFYIQNKNVAIECNGTYYHSVQYGKDKNYHYNKSSLCEKQNIQLIHIFEYMWNNPKQQVILKNIIKDSLGINDKIDVKECNITITKCSNVKKFFNENHIQGFKEGKFAICLEYNKEIVMSYIINEDKKYKWKIIRRATKLGYNIINGDSTLFNYFIELYNPESCIIYLDYNYYNENKLVDLPNIKYINTKVTYKNYELNKNKMLRIYNAGIKVYLYENLLN